MLESIVKMTLMKAEQSVARSGTVCQDEDWISQEEAPAVPDDDESFEVKNPWKPSKICLFQKTLWRQEALKLLDKKSFFLYIKILTFDS